MILWVLNGNNNRKPRIFPCIWFLFLSSRNAFFSPHISLLICSHVIPVVWVFRAHVKMRVCKDTNIYRQPAFLGFLKSLFPPLFSFSYSPHVLLWWVLGACMEFAVRSEPRGEKPWVLHAVTENGQAGCMCCHSSEFTGPLDRSETHCSVLYLWNSEAPTVCSFAICRPFVCDICLDRQGIGGQVICSWVILRPPFFLL